MSCLKTYISILYCCNCWYNYECIFVIAPWGTLIGIKILYCIVLYCCKQAIMVVNMSFKSVLAISVCTYDVNKHLCNEVCAEWAELRSIQKYWQGQKANSRIYTHSSSSNIIKPNNTSNLSVRLPVLKKN